MFEGIDDAPARIRHLLCRTQRSRRRSWQVDAAQQFARPSAQAGAAKRRAWQLAARAGTIPGHVSGDGASAGGAGLGSLADALGLGVRMRLAARVLNDLLARQFVLHSLGGDLLGTLAPCALFLELLPGQLFGPLARAFRLALALARLLFLRQTLGVTRAFLVQRALLGQSLGTRRLGCALSLFFFGRLPLLFVTVLADIPPSPFVIVASTKPFVSPAAYARSAMLVAANAA